MEGYFLIFFLGAHFSRAKYIMDVLSNYQNVFGIFDTLFAVSVCNESYLWIGINHLKYGSVSFGLNIFYFNRKRFGQGKIATWRPLQKVFS